MPVHCLERSGCSADAEGWCWGGGATMAEEGTACPPATQGWFWFSWCRDDSLWGQPRKGKGEVCKVVDGGCCGCCLRKKDTVFKNQCSQLLRLVCFAWFNSKPLSKVGHLWDRSDNKNCVVLLCVVVSKCPFLYLWLSVTVSVQTWNLWHFWEMWTKRDNLFSHIKSVRKLCFAARRPVFNQGFWGILKPHENVKEM